MKIIIINLWQCLIVNSFNVLRWSISYSKCEFCNYDCVLALKTSKRCFAIYAHGQQDYWNITETVTNLPIIHLITSFSTCIVWSIQKNLLILWLHCIHVTVSTFPDIPTSIMTNSVIMSWFSFSWFYLHTIIFESTKLNAYLLLCLCYYEIDIDINVTDSAIFAKYTKMSSQTSWL
jgi:hypothetical protein